MKKIAIGRRNSTGRRNDAHQRLTSLLTLVALIGLVTLLASRGSPVLQNILVNALINLILVIGLYIFVGNSGVFSFGHIGLMAIGAYTAGLVRIPTDTKLAILQLPGWLVRAHATPFEATLIGGGAATAVALLIALPLMRLGGLTAGLGTFAVLNIIYIVAQNWNAVTGGSTGMPGLPTTTTIQAAFLWAIAAVVVAWSFQQTRLCLRVRASREDEPAAGALGVNVVTDRAAAFVLSAFICGVAGALYGQLAGSFGPDAFFLQTTFTIVAMLVVGGRYSLTGAVVGSIFMSSLSEGLRRLEGGFRIASLDVPSRPGLEEVGLALALLITLIARPRGLTGGREWSVLDALSFRRLADPAPENQPQPRIGNGT